MTLLLIRIYADEWLRFDLGPRDSPRNSEVNRIEINHNPQQAKPLNVNVNNPNNSVGRRIPPNITSLEEDEMTFNAAAARELSLELEALKNNNLNQLPSQVDQHSQSTPTPGAYSHYPTPPLAYAQVAYQTTPNLPTQQQQPLDMRNILPPRLQALNNKPMDSQVPPRFQNSSSSIANSLPPRFQTSQVSAPGGLNF